MDDDKIMKVSFPVGTGGAEVIVSRPTPAQAFVLALSRKPGDGATADMERLVRRITRVMEQLMGQETWIAVIEEGLITGTLAPEDLSQLTVDVLRFDWTLGAAAKEAVEIIVQDVSPPEPEPVRPAPRVVSGG